jgi:hypothetical protein
MVAFSAARFQDERGIAMDMHKSESTERRGKVGWVILWLLGVPIPVLLILFLIRGCT